MFRVYIFSLIKLSRAYFVKNNGSFDIPVVTIFLFRGLYRLPITKGVHEKLQFELTFLLVEIL